MKPLLLAPLCVALCACDDLSMARQHKMRTYAPSTLWSDGASARPLPDGAVARDAVARDAAAATPPPLNAALLERGQQRYQIYCTPCHGLAGDGDGIVVKRGFPQPAPFAGAAVKNVSSRQIFAAITYGAGTMAAFAARIPPRDRWAIVAYVRALQLAAGAPLALAPEAREKLPGDAP